MSVTTELLERWKSAKNINSDNQAAIRLGLGRATISKWRHTPMEAAPETIKRLAEELGEEPTGYVLRAEAPKQKTAASRRAMMDIARKFHPFAVLLLLTASVYIYNSAIFTVYYVK